MSRWYTAKLNEEETKLKFKGDVAKMMMDIDNNMDHLGPGSTGKKTTSKVFNKD